jgi:hypothetical protein
MKLLSLTAATFVALFGSIASGDVINLDLTGSGGDFDFNSNTGSYTTVAGDGVAGIQLDFEAFVGGVANSGDELNADSSSFGINSGPAGDNTTQLDGVSESTRESFRITFSSLNPQVTSLVLTSISITNFAGTDAGTITIGGNTGAIAAGNGSTIPGHSDLLGQSFTVAYTGPIDDLTGSADGFGVSAITLTAAVPEPASGIIVGTFAFGLATRRKRPA